MHGLELVIRCKAHTSIGQPAALLLSFCGRWFATVGNISQHGPLTLQNLLVDRQLSVSATIQRLKDKWREATGYDELVPRSKPWMQRRYQQKPTQSAGLAGIGFYKARLCEGAAQATLTEPGVLTAPSILVGVWPRFSFSKTKGDAPRPSAIVTSSRPQP